MKLKKTLLCYQLLNLMKIVICKSNTRWQHLFQIKRWKFSPHQNYGYLLTRNAYWRGRLSTVDLLIKIACFVKKKNILFSIKSIWFEPVSAKMPTVLILPLQLEFPGPYHLTNDWAYFSFRVRLIKQVLVFFAIFCLKGPRFDFKNIPLSLNSLKELGLALRSFIYRRVQKLCKERVVVKKKLNLLLKIFLDITTINNQ